MRKATRKKNLLLQSEIDQMGMTTRDVAFEALIKPWQINALDPAVVCLFNPVFIITQVANDSTACFHNSIHCLRIRNLLLFL
jgi:hypothetical protein